MDTTLTHMPAGWPGPERVGGRDPGEIPNYDLLAFIKSGGFGDVWLARERVTGVRRAVKVVFKDDPQRAARDIAGVRRYQRCAHNHPHLLQILTVGETSSCFYYVMEAADNRAPRPADDYEPGTLRTLMIETGPLEGRAALVLLDKLVSAVRRLHEQGLAHYDLKPENILIVEGEPKIADVGLVGSTEQAPPGSGTPAYMTPQGHADDCYALGKILYELVSGRPASDFPRLPAALLAGPTPELTAAVAILNRACQTAAERRYQATGELATAVAAALTRHAGFTGWWRRRSLISKVAVSAAAVAVVIGLWMLAWSRAGSFGASRSAGARTATPPPLIFEHDIALEPSQLTLVRDHRYLGDPRGTPLLVVGGSLLPDAGVYVGEIPDVSQPLENFVVDFHLRCTRPWGSLCLGVSAHEDGRGGVWAGLTGQPDGLGLRTYLRTVNELGSPGEADEAIIGHPQPGLAYVLRLARCREHVVLALWPLARPSAEPLTLLTGGARTGIAARYITIACSGYSDCDRIELSDVRVASYAAAVERAEWELPAPVENLLESGITRAFVPPVPARSGTIRGNLLSGPWHPRDSGAWMSIGSWAWWSGGAPSPGGKLVRCMPFSTVERGALRAEQYYEGEQYLRFDGAVWSDFEAVLKVNLVRAGAEEYEPLVCESHEGGIGLAFRLRDASPGCAWGGGYRVALCLPSDATLETHSSLSRFTGLSLTGHRASAVRGEKSVTMQKAHGICPREELLSPNGFTLRVRAVGPCVNAFLNGRLILDAVDADPDYLPDGRIALFASRLMATFESLEVTPLPRE